MALINGDTGRLLRITKFNSSGTWTKQSDTLSVLVKVLGGGGGGAASGANAGTPGAGGGGAEALISVRDISTVTVTVGVGGTAGLTGGTVPGSGGTSSFGSYCVASGATGSPSSPGIGTTGDILYRGSLANRTGNTTGSVGGGGAMGFAGGNEAAAGTANTGAGGGGGVAGTSNGFAGGSGVVIVYEYS
jgi:hypothetical protein